jgi:hypothetical protein
MMLGALCLRIDCVGAYLVSTDYQLLEHFDGLSFIPVFSVHVSAQHEQLVGKALISALQIYMQPDYWLISLRKTMPSETSKCMMS